MKGPLEKLSDELEALMLQHGETKSRENIRSRFEQLRAKIGELSEYLASLKTEQGDTKDEAAPSFPSTKGTTNYARLCRLLVDFGSQVLRDSFDAIHPPVGLQSILTRHPMRATLLTLRTRVLNPIQWGKLYPSVPSSVSSANFDFFLLLILLRNICGLTPPATGWDSLPLATDVSKEANIARLKYYRNVVYGRASQASVDDATFNIYWQDISDAIIGLGGASYESGISKLKNECMDPLIKVKMKERMRDTQ
ncbi:E3 ubiquitin-protein ligase DZIP3-like, partial [Stylophora pistillata]